MNGDGVRDLIVGHPYTGAEALQYHGGVSVYLGEVGGDFSQSPWLTVECSDHPCGLGATMAQSGQEVIVGATTAAAGGRQRGAVLALSPATVGNLSVPGDLQWLATGSQDFQQFGSSISLHQDLIAVGSPYYRIPANGEPVTCRYIPSLFLPP